MTKQLVLLQAESGWRMDRSTCELGRRGVAQAREALRVARNHMTDDESAIEPAEPSEKVEIDAGLELNPAA